MNASNKQSYIPSPANLEKVELPESLTELIEQIAENVHEVWAKNRMEEGWIYDTRRDDIKKTHPCLVPYDQLPESEKEYDRNTATDTLKLVILLGYNISKNQ